MKNRFLVILTLLIFTLSEKATANDSLLISTLLKSIETSQLQQDDGEFYKGSFPSFRECVGPPHNYQPNNNIFYPAIINFSLRNMLPHLNEENKKIASTIIKNTLNVFPYFQNRKGHPFYYFWPKGNEFPHAHFFRYLLKNVFSQSEDADDSVITLMANDADDSTCKVLKRKMIDNSNLHGRKIISTYKKYRKIPAYSTFLSLSMPVDFDFAVHCNFLYFMFQKKLPLVKQDSATISLLAQMIENREYMKAPIFISPYYGKPSVVFYHISRLLGKFRIPELDVYKPQLITDMKNELSKVRNVMDKIIIRTALLRMGEIPPPLDDITSISEFEKSNQNKFCFGLARAACWFPTPFKQIFLSWSYICYYQYCTDYNKVLWLEYLVEKNKIN